MRFDPVTSLRWTSGSFSWLKHGAWMVAVLILLVCETSWAENALDQLPASYEGELPGAGGPIAWHLDLLPAECYQLRLTYVNRPEPNRFDTIGRWMRDASGRIVLRGERGGPVFLMPDEDGAALRKLDLCGDLIVSGHNDRLARLPTPALIEPQLVLTGLFTNAAGAGIITLCANGQLLPVAPEGDFSALKTAFHQASPLPEQPLRVSLEGVITQRPIAGEPGSEQPTLVVKSFIAVWPYDDCQNIWADFPLRGTYWKLENLGDQPVTTAGKQRQAHLVFAVDELRVFGSGGCNRLIGNVLLDGDKLRFEQMGSTMMACPDGMELEAQFLKALGNVVRYRLCGSRLDLLDDGDVVIARFTAEKR